MKMSTELEGPDIGYELGDTRGKSSKLPFVRDTQATRVLLE